MKMGGETVIKCGISESISNSNTTDINLKNVAGESNFCSGQGPSSTIGQGLSSTSSPGFSSTIAQGPSSTSGHAPRSTSVQGPSSTSGQGSSFSSVQGPSFHSQEPSFSSISRTESGNLPDILFICSFFNI